MGWLVGIGLGGSEVCVGSGAEVGGKVAVTKLGVDVESGATSTEPQLIQNIEIKAIILLRYTSTIVSNK